MHARHPSIHWKRYCQWFFQFAPNDIAVIREFWDIAEIYIIRPSYDYVYKWQAGAADAASAYYGVNTIGVTITKSNVRSINVGISGRVGAHHQIQSMRS
jgi:hypothetical protein